MKPKLLFISPRYLIPADSGGKVRTRDILMGLKGGRFEVTLIAPCSEEKRNADRAKLDELCDKFIYWPESPRGRLFPTYRMMCLLSRLPVAVATDRSSAALRRVAEALETKPDVVVVDFPHTGVLVPYKLPVPSVLFTHNIEAEIFRRHIDVAKNALWRAVWRAQTGKMERFEREQLKRYDAVIAISERDKAYFESHGHNKNVAVIPTGLNVKQNPFRSPPSAGTPNIVFCGSMDWPGNIDAMGYFVDEIWPLIVAARPQVQFTVVGRTPAPALIELVRQRGYKWTFTGYVDDVRPYIYAAQMCVIPLRVGGGTRLKVYEAMGLGCPVVSTAIGVEGLPVKPGVHYELADAPKEFADAVIRLIDNPQQRENLAQSARHYVEENFSSEKVARVFEGICASVCRQ